MFPQALRNLGVAALLSAGVALTGAFATGCSAPSDTSNNAVVGQAAPATQADAQPGRPPQPPGLADPNSKCTDQYDYSADSRSNAEINSIGDSTHTCPPVQHG